MKDMPGSATNASARRHSLPTHTTALATPNGLLSNARERVACSSCLSQVVRQPALVWTTKELTLRRPQSVKPTTLALVVSAASFQMIGARNQAASANMTGVAPRACSMPNRTKRPRRKGRPTEATTLCMDAKPQMRRRKQKGKPSVGLSQRMSANIQASMLSVICVAS